MTVEAANVETVKAELEKVELVKVEIALSALTLQRQINGLMEQLDQKKEELREIANGNKLEIVVQNVGIVNVSTPRDGSEEVVLRIDEEKLKSSPDLKAKLISSGIAKEEIKKISPAKASVTIKPNV